MILLLIVSIILLQSILHQMVEELGVLMHGPSTLLEVHEFLVLPSHDARGDVMGVESLTKLIPRHLIVHGASDDVVGPPYTRISPQLMCDEEGLLSLSATQEPELGLNHMKLVVGFQRLSCLCEEQQVSGHEVPIHGWILSMVVPSPMASTSWSGVGHELPQQLILLILRLEDGGNSLGQGRRWGWVPIWLSRLVITPFVASVHHSVIPMSYR
jgi:hypothetical protein